MGASSGQIDQSPREHLSPKQVAAALGVSESSVKRWCDRGLLRLERTVGGHRRLSVASVVAFMRDNGYLAAQPEILGLPVGVGRHAVSVQQAGPLLREALERGDERSVRQLVVGLFLSSVGIGQLGDLAIAPAFIAIGERWAHGDVEVYQERRGVEIISRTLYELRALIPEPEDAAPLAMGGTLAHDPYTLPNTLVEVALRELGWRAESLGPGNPATTLGAAIRAHRPRLFWLSVSAPLASDRLREDLATLSAACKHVGAALVIGGRGIEPTVATSGEFTALCQSLDKLADLVRALWPRPKAV